MFDHDESLPLLSDQLITTRLCIFFFVILTFILVLFNGLTLQTYSTTIQSPSLSQFEDLNNHYESTLICTCSQPNIGYQHIISFAPEYHQVCSSQFVTQTFISSLFTTNMSRYSALDFRLMAMSQFQVLAYLCKTVSWTMNDTLKQLYSKQFYSNRALSHQSFDAEIEAIVEQLKSKTLADVQNTDWFISRVLTQSRFMSGLNTNTYIILQYSNGNTSNKYHIGYFPSDSMDIMHFNTSSRHWCSCSNSINCIYPAAFYNWTGRLGDVEGRYIPMPSPMFTVPGMMVGCLPRSSMFASTLECFYNSSCLNLIRISSNKFIPLNRKMISRFSINMTIEAMFIELFIEKWNNESNFTNYYHLCAPDICSYTFEIRRNIIYLVTVLLSIFGGLVLIMHTTTPIMIRVFRYLQQKYNGNTLSESNDNDLLLIKRIRRFMIYILKKLQPKFLNLNIFKSIFADPKLGIMSTRLYLVLLIITGSILTFYSFFTTHLLIITIQQPTQDQFEKLNAQYPTTLVCPCSQLSMVYNEIMTTEPVYHQLCTSDFIRDDRWLQYFNFVSISPNHAPFFTFRFDFRIGNGLNLFLLMQTLCTTAQETVNNALQQFNTSQLVTSNAISYKMFEQKTNAIIEQFQNETQNSFNILFSQLRASMEGNQLCGEYDGKAAFVYSKQNPLLMGFRYTFSLNPNCSCAITNECIYPMGFYSQSHESSSSSGTINKAIPGLFIGCSLVDSLLMSALECFYNRSCIQLLIDWRNFSTTSVLAPFNPVVTQTIPLNSTLLIRFLPNSTFETIIATTFIEEWKSFSNFSDYFQRCQPVQCTYTFSQKHYISSVLTTLLGLMGGLSVACRLIAPMCIRLITSIIHRCSANRTMIKRNFNYGYYIRQKLCSLNLFRQPTATNEDDTHAILATRFYLLLLLITTFVILIFTGFNQQIHSVTIYSPSQQTFAQLYNQFNATLSCPCTQTLIRQGLFLSITAQLHQVCSSDFVTPDWWKYLWGVDIYWIYQDAQLLSGHFRLLGSLCVLARQSIDNATQMFMMSDLLSIEVLPSKSFQTQIDSLINTFITQTQQDFRRLQSFMIDTIRSNQLINIAGTTWTLAYTNAQENYVLATIPVSSYNNNCVCAASLDSCSRPLYMNYYSNEITLPGVVGGCLPINGLRLSTLQCFYDSKCLNNLSNALIGRPAIFKYTPKPLKTTLHSIFTSTTPISILIDALFVENWINSTNYSNYFSSCAPHSCSYRYTQRMDAFYMITTLVGLYGGLTVVFRFIVWHSLRIIRIKIIPIFAHRQLSKVHASVIETSSIDISNEPVN